MKDDKAVGQDGLTAEIFKYGGDMLQDELCQICNLALETGVIPQNWKDIEIKLLYTSGCKMDPNYRGNALLSHASKIFERMRALSWRDYQHS